MNYQHFFIYFVSIILTIFTILQVCILAGFSSKLVSMNEFFTHGNQFFIDMDKLIVKLNNFSLPKPEPFSMLRA